MTSKKFTLQKDYYGAGFVLYKKKTITINPGLTVLVGCNGSGKSTLLYHIKDELTIAKIPVLSFDNLSDGGTNSISKYIWENDIPFASTLATASEGESIIMNIGKLASRLKKFIDTGDPDDESTRLFKNLFKDKIPPVTSNERWILFDAVDSGLSVDNVIDLKDLFNIVITENPDYEIYIVISANEYELARESKCFDVYNGKYTKFKDYDEYRNFIIESRRIKDARWEDEKEES